MPSSENLSSELVRVYIKALAPRSTDLQSAARWLGKSAGAP
jgi:hypothetical protein